MAPSGSGVGGTGRAAARGESSDPREQRRELVPVLGAASACALGSVILMSQASPLLAGSICAGDRSKTLKLLAQAAVCRSAAAITFLPLIGRLSDRSLVLCHMLVGVCGVQGANDIARDAALSDVFSAGELASVTAKVRAMMACGMIIGPVAGGYAAKVSIRAPFALSAALCGAGAAIINTGLVETHRPEERSKAAAAQDCEGGVFAADKCLNPLSCVGLLNRSAKLRWLTVAACCSLAAEYAEFAGFLVIRCRDLLGWTSVESGQFTSAGGVLAVLSSSLTSTVIAAFGRTAATLGGTVVTVLRNLLVATATTDAAMYSSLAGILLGGVTLRLSSIFAEHNKTAVADGLGSGEAAAMLNNAFAITRLVIPQIHAMLYRKGREGAPWLLSAALAATAGATIAAKIEFDKLGTKGK